MASKSASKQQLVNALKDLTEDVTPVESAEDLKAARMAKTNNKGEMLLCNFTLQKKEMAPDPLCITINDQHFWCKRGKSVKVPWYLVEHMLHNVDRKYRNVKVGPLQYKVEFDDMTSEPFQYQLIDPAMKPDGTGPFEIEGPRTPPQITL